MTVYTYKTKGGKDLIYSYLDKLPKKQSQIAYLTISKLQNNGLKGLETKPIRGKVWEIKFFEDNRIFYVLLDKDNIYLLHACKKQKGKAEKFELETALQRAKEITDV